MPVLIFFSINHKYFLSPLNTSQSEQFKKTSDFSIVYIVENLYTIMNAYRKLYSNMSVEIIHTICLIRNDIYLFTLAFSIYLHTALQQKQ